MTTMTWIASKSRDSEEREERKRCVKEAYRKQTGSGIRVNTFDVKAEVN